ncbi:MAG: FtsX-like permease family protein [Planctomycetota bacterium]
MTRLAWKNLTHDKRRLLIACTGIGFAVLLMFVQLGFESALFSSQIQLIDKLAGEVFITSPARFALAAEKRFPLAALAQARSCEGVEGAYPVYAEWMAAVLRNLDPLTNDPSERQKQQKGYRIRVIGYQVGDPVFRATDFAALGPALRPPQTAIIDVKSKTPNFAFPVEDLETLAQMPAELAGKRVRLVGAFDLGADFVHDGNLVMHAPNFASYFPNRRRFGDPLSVVDIGVVEVQDGYDAADVAARISEKLGDEAVAYTHRDFVRKEKGFWRRSTPIGVVFSAGTIIGFIVGVVICYQVIFSDITDHMAEFATLKAMGYGADYFTRLIVAEAFWLSIMGFVPGALVSTALYAGLAAKTGLPLIMTPTLLAWVLLFTISMCTVSGLLAVRKLLVADPASLF